MKVRATVVRAESGWAEVLVERHAACAGCGACGLIEERGSFRVRDDLGARQGSRVVVYIPPRSFLKAAFLVYALPLIAFGVGLLVGVRVFSVVGGSLEETKALALGLLFMGGTIALTWQWQVRGGGASLTPHLQEIIPEGREVEAAK